MRKSSLGFGRREGKKRVKTTRNFRVWKFTGGFFLEVYSFLRVGVSPKEQSLRPEPAGVSHPDYGDF